MSNNSEQNTSFLYVFMNVDQFQYNPKIGNFSGNDNNSNMAKPLRENITWPPPEYEHKNQLRSTFKDVVTQGKKRQSMHDVCYHLILIVLAIC